MSYQNNICRLRKLTSAELNQVKIETRLRPEIFMTLLRVMFISKRQLDGNYLPVVEFINSNNLYESLHFH